MRKITDIALKFIEKSTAASGEIYLCRTFSSSLSLKNGTIQDIQGSGNLGMGVRVIRDGRIGFSYTSDLTPGSIEKAVRNAERLSAYTRKDECFGFAKSDNSLKSSGNTCCDLESIPLKEKIDFVNEIERSAREYDKRIKGFRETSYDDSWGSVCIANTNGYFCSYDIAKVYGATQSLAEENGQKQVGFEMDYAYDLKSLNPSLIGKMAAESAVGKLNAVKFSTRKTSVVFSDYVTANIIGVLSNAFFAENVLKGKSLFENRIEERIGSEAITVIDDGSFAKGSFSSPVDGEGIPVQETVLVKNGILKGYLHNIYSAAKMNAFPTGNMLRSGFLSPPFMGHTNIYLKPGKSSRNELFKEACNGVYINDVMGLHTMNTISGEFSLGASGNLIKNGELGDPVDGMAVAGNIFDLLGSIKTIGSDFRMFASGSGAPSVLAENVSISGR